MLVFIHALENFILSIRFDRSGSLGEFVAATVPERFVEEVKLKNRLFLADPPQRRLRQLPPSFEVSQEFGDGSQLRGNIQEVIDRNVCEWYVALC